MITEKEPTQTSTIMDKIFETNFRFHVKYRTKEKFNIEFNNVTYQLHLSRGILSVSYNFIPCQEVEIFEETNLKLSCETLSVNYERVVRSGAI